MHLFSDYIQPITSWLHTHPYWALIFTFVVAFAESLAIIGSVIPGSVTMTAIGILAGSGIMRIDLTLLASTLGAIAGDGASYMLGYIYSDRLRTIWPFERYPHWLKYGEEFFENHGGKSVLIGRFVGPLRSIIPVIAGMMHMSHLRFYMANALSAVAWSMLYVLPGVLIGTASNELSPESATRLFVIILILLGGIWFISLLLKWLLIRINHLLRTNLHGLWTSMKKHPGLTRFIYFITPPSETNYYATAGLMLLFFLTLLTFSVVSLLVIQQSWIAGFNQPVHLVLQSLRATSFDVFFILSAQLCSYLTLLTAVFIVLFATLYHHDWRTLGYWLSLIASCTLLLFLMHWIIQNPRPIELADVMSANSFPAIQLTYASAIFLVVFLYCNQYGNPRLKRFIRFIFPTAVLLAGFSGIYLGDHWLTDIIGAYLGGACLGLLHWLFYRRRPARLIYSSSKIYLLLFFMFCISILSCILHCHQEIRRHQPYFAQYVFTDQMWWNQNKPILPLFRVNRLGKPVNLFNVQYAGSLTRLENSLSAFGWKKQNESLYKSVMKRLNSKPSNQGMPLMAELYLNRKPVLHMTYEPKDGSPLLMFRLWRSNYHLKHYRQPIWIGSVHPRPFPKNHVQNKSKGRNTLANPSLFYLHLALADYNQREVILPTNSNPSIKLDVEPKLLLIREVAANEFFLSQLMNMDFRFLD